MSKIKKLRIVHVDDGHQNIYLSGKLISSTSHDEHGWDGMNAAKECAIQMAKMFGIEIIIED